jgi:transposase
VFPGTKKKAGLVLAKLGHVKMVMHRAIKGLPKTAIVKRTPTGKWFVSISVEIGEEEAAQKRLPACGKEVGIDVGLKTFAYLSTGEEIANPRFFRTEEAALARAQRKLSKAPKGSQQRKQRRKVVARVHERYYQPAHKFHRARDMQADQAFRFHCGGSARGAQYDEESKIGQKYCRCVVVDVLHILALQSGGSWQRSSASESGLYVANLFGV